MATQTDSPDAIPVSPITELPPEGAVVRTPFPIVGIGASAGGLEAFEAFFELVRPTSVWRLY
jgi:chemotaxis response regulator CheB